MPLRKNIYLLKEYIKTLVTTEVVFPGVVPRSLEHEFSHFELEAIYFGLTFVIKKAPPNLDDEMIAAFEQIDDPQMNIHWFLIDYWQKIVPLLAEYPDPAEEYLSGVN
ncbi:hypothetical protein GCM10028808_73820 [Spirosoma migulaei]